MKCFFFAAPEKSNLTNLVKILLVFCSLLGLKINIGKSTLLRINLEEDEVQNLANIIGCSVGSWPIKYLGLPLGSNPLRKEF